MFTPDYTDNTTTSTILINTNTNNTTISIQTRLLYYTI